MKKILFVATLFLMFASTAAAQIARGTVKEGLTVDSKILGKPQRYTVYLPFDYETSSRKYPVVYLLHGYTDNDTGWMQFGEAHLIADEAIAKREIPPMIIVMPDGGVSWYVNNHDGSVKYEDFFFQEFIPTIEKTYRIRAEKAYRGISGLSMGGHGSLVYSLRHPEMFVACAAFSAAVFTDEEVVANPDANWARVFGPVFGANLKGQERINDHLKSYSPIHIVKNAKPDAFKSVRFYIDCGDDDFLYKGNSTFHTVLRDLKIAHEYRVRDGGHTWTYWRTGLADGLKFIGESFHR
ncbi:MAG TPA: alpha/beta hydrolase-fold protein [Blastocatellia bacterium]|nr:alpha/beta hydrolase-fold protein [Blastocatellia bacterium]HMV83134.1 alpha/beta hydrolase-fold protein [Blastocatellia bacterium]HMX26343.1 alpha/beta hydrolase-fold protein [Blastocatellia bacterium]HMY70643.1 alpha/beta hydrolase-fold protein [Blastocatellia bacterium]HMZ20082.1 alpha/beta hydrolase-fold protein [Blastocatellia bacterium]